MRLASVGSAFPRHRYDQEELTERLTSTWGARPAVERALASFHRNVKVDGRYLARPTDWYGPERTFGERNAAWIEEALPLGEAAATDALTRAGLAPEDVDAFVFTTVTGLASPSIDARLINRMPFRRDVQRMPLFGLGCVAGAAGVSRAADLVRGRPDAVALLLSIELCSLTFRFDDLSIPNLVSSALFGDGATAAVVVGSGREASGPTIRATRSVFYRDTEDVMGWDISEEGFRIVLSAAVPDIVRENLRADVDAFLGENGLTRDDITTWVCHPGGPKVLQAMGEALELEEDDLKVTWRSLQRVGNLSSSSVLLVLKETLEEHAPTPGSWGLLLAMGPGFCSELVLLRW